MSEALVDIERYLHQQGDRVSHYLASIFHNVGQPTALFSSMNYSLLAGGKRLRPVLCIATAQSFGVDGDDILPVAAALEMVHTYSLIHDDLPCMDNDDMRRGKPTNHKVYGEALALLAGDALLTYAFEQLSQPLNSITPSQQLALIQVLTHASGCFGMVAGQVADMEAENQPGSLEMIKFIHRNKTGKLIEASVEMGAIFAGASGRERASVREFGERIGLVFQIVDDILDVVGDAAELGKKTGMDAERNKVTYPSLLGLDRAKKLADETFEEAVGALSEAGIHSPLLTDIGKYICMRTK